MQGLNKIWINAIEPQLANVKLIFENIIGASILGWDIYLMTVDFTLIQIVIAIIVSLSLIAVNAITIYQKRLQNRKTKLEIKELMKKLEEKHNEEDK